MLDSLGTVRVCDSPSWWLSLEPWQCFSPLSLVEEAGQGLVEHSVHLICGWGVCHPGSLYSCLEPSSKEQMLIMGGQGCPGVVIK